jgi:hypothetical protein
MSCCPKKPGPPLTTDEDPSDEDVARFGSETVACKGCGAEIYDESPWCHKCGESQGAEGESVRGVPVWAMVTLGVVAGGLLIVALRLL